MTSITTEQLSLLLSALNILVIPSVGWFIVYPLQRALIKMLTAFGFGMEIESRSEKEVYLTFTVKFKGKDDWVSNVISQRSWNWFERIFTREYFCLVYRTKKWYFTYEVINKSSKVILKSNRAFHSISHVLFHLRGQDWYDSYIEPNDSRFVINDYLTI